MPERTYREGIKATPVRVFTHMVNGVETEYAHEIKDPEAFRALLAIAKKEMKSFGSSVTLQPVEVYAKMKHLFISPQGDAGFAVSSEGHGGSGFSSPSAENGVMSRLIKLGIEKGGVRLCCFDTILPDYYANHGGRVVARRKWDATIPKGGPNNDWDEKMYQSFNSEWDKKAYQSFNNGEPDVCYVVSDQRKVLGYFSNYTADVKPYMGYVETYEEATRTQHLALEKIRIEETRIGDLLRRNSMEKPNWMVGPTPGEDFTARALDWKDENTLLVARIEGVGGAANSYVYMVPRERVKDLNVQLGADVSIKSNVTAQEEGVIKSELANYGKKGARTTTYAILETPPGAFSAILLGRGDDGETVLVAQLSGKQKVRNVYRVSLGRTENIQLMEPGQTIHIKALSEQRRHGHLAKL